VTYLRKQPTSWRHKKFSYQLDGALSCCFHYSLSPTLRSCGGLLSTIRTLAIKVKYRLDIIMDALTHMEDFNNLKKVKHPQSAL